MKTFLITLMSVMLLVSALSANDLPATNPVATTQAITSAAPQFQNGDRVCFVGDSITQTGNYLGQIMLFYATRFPDRKIEGYNCGVNGDSSGGVIVLKRYEWDVLKHNPTVATIMYGMNDVGRDYYGKELTGPDMANKRKWPLVSYSNYMLKLSQILTDANCKIIYLTPSIYDQTGNQTAHNNFGVNDALGVCAHDCQGFAAKFNAGLVDFYGPMTVLNQQQQAKDPSFTLVGPDRIHPGAEGSLVMAYLFLKAQSVSATVSDMAIDAAKTGVVKQENCQITELKNEKGVVSFVVKENSLPFPIAPDLLKKVEPLVPLTTDLNREMLTVSNLPAGQYKLLIDGQAVQDCTADELNSGVNLAGNTTTPQYKQAAKVADLCAKRRQLEGLLRTFAGVTGAVVAAKVDPADEQAARKVIQDELEKRRKNNVGAPHFELYLKYSATEWQKMATDAADLWDKVYVANQPNPHTFEIRAK